MVNEEWILVKGKGHSSLKYKKYTTVNISHENAFALLQDQEACVTCSTTPPPPLDPVLINAKIAKIHAIISRETKEPCDFTRKLVNIIESNWRPTRIIALGCGSPTNVHCGLEKSSIHQWAIALLLRQQFNIKCIEIYDPIMNHNDWEVWNRVHNINNTFSIDNSKSKTVVSKGDEKLLMWMPHVEQSLYDIVIQAIENRLDPLQVARGSSTQAADKCEKFMIIGNCQAKAKYMIKLPLYTQLHAFNNTFVNYM